MIDLQQIKKDFDNKVIVCHATLINLVEYALMLERENMLMVEQLAAAPSPVQQYGLAAYAQANADSRVTGHAQAVLGNEQIQVIYPGPHFKQARKDLRAARDSQQQLAAMQSLTDADIDPIWEPQYEEYGQVCDNEDFHIFARAILEAASAKGGNNEKEN